MRKKEFKYHYHPDFNGWRALAYNRQGGKHFLYMDTSMENIRKGYSSAFYEILTLDEQLEIVRISMEKWEGSPVRGHWSAQNNLKLPRIYRN